MASSRPPSRYPSIDSRSSRLSDPPPPPPDLKNPKKTHLPSLRRLVSAPTVPRQSPPPPPPTTALTRTRSKSNDHDLGSMVRKLMEKKPKAAADRPVLAIPVDFIAEDMKKTAKGSNFTALHRKLFQKKAMESADRTDVRALTEVKSNTRTLAMVLRSERELLSQNKEFESEVAELRLKLEEKDREVDKLKDLCLRQREEIGALKNVILFPDSMSSHLREILGGGGSDLNRVIPSIQKQVSSLTGQLQCLADNLSQVKVDQDPVMTCSNRSFSSLSTPSHDGMLANCSEFVSMVTETIGSPDDMFLKDLNPCLTPYSVKTKSMEYEEMTNFDYSPEYRSSGNKTTLSSESEMYEGFSGHNFSKSSEYRYRQNYVSSAQKASKSDDDKFFTGKINQKRIY
ncbi:hypothetical protein QJS10_CPA05g01041 [Acorus calamus]|uniref:Uncharacterized protein n=1 Tax=Acorus calamus TaxID=4465 RepID=A0AAV9EYU5_ACOCL|nr:hypothetical protein QJS10_CPA05g01041 [Acorus calamus]